MNCGGNIGFSDYFYNLPANMEADTISEDTFEDVDDWLQDIRNRQIESEAKRKSFLTRESLGNYTDEEIHRIIAAFLPDTEGSVSIEAATESIVRRVEQLGPGGVEKLVRNGSVPVATPCGAFRVA